MLNPISPIEPAWIIVRREKCAWLNLAASIPETSFTPAPPGRFVGQLRLERVELELSNRITRNLVSLNNSIFRSFRRSLRAIPVFQCAAGARHSTATPTGLAIYSANGQS